MPITREGLRGIYAGLPTPWDASGRLDTQTFIDNVERVIALGVEGVYTSDTTGEFYALTFDEFKQLVAALVQTTRGTAVETMAGCTALDTAGVLQRMEYAASQGIGAVHVAVPFWSALADSEIEQFYSDLARGVPGLPIVHYNSGYAKRVLTGGHYRRLIDACPTLIGTKIVSSDHYTWAELMHTVPDLPHFCGDLFFLPGLMLGARGMYSSFIYVFPRAMRRLYELAQARDWEPAIRLHQQVAAFFVEALDPLWGAGYVDAGLDKALAEAAGHLAGGRSLRPPYAQVSQEHAGHLRRTLEKYLPLLESEGTS